MVLGKFLEPKMVVMTRDEFHEYYSFKYGNGELKFNKKETMIVTVIATLIITIGCAYAKQPDLSKVNELGALLLNLSRAFGHWVFMAMACFEIIKNAMKMGCTKGSSEILIKYGVSYASLYIITWLFDLIKDVLG